MMAVAGGRIVEGVRDRLGEQRVRADLDEGAVSAAASCTARLNRTGLRRFATQYSAPNIVALLGYSAVLMTGMVGPPGSR